METRRRELEDAEAAMAESTVAAYEDALRTTHGPIRHVMVTTDIGAAHDEAFVRRVQAEVAGGRVLRTLYPSSFLHDGREREATWMRGWADVGEQQRLVEEVPHPFTVFGEDLVMSALRWGEVTDDLLAVRTPVLVRAFVALFDQLWQAAVPVPHTRQDGTDDRLLAMLASGLKDEAIARYLGTSLRTVRRRVATLMTEHDAQTRFQLGMAVERRGLGR